MKQILAVLLLCAACFAQTMGGHPQGNAITGVYTVATLPTAPRAGTLAIVSDGTAGSACTVGGSNIITLCIYQGAAWHVDGAIACATCVTAASALTSNQVVVGGGSQASAVATYLIADGTTQLSIGPQDTTNNGILGLRGKTSGTATLTAPDVAGTSTNAIVSTNVLSVPVGAAATPGYAFTGALNYGMFADTGNNEVVLSAAGTNGLALNGLSGSTVSRYNYALGASLNAPDTFWSRAAAGIFLFGASANGTDGKIKAAAYMSVGTKFTTNAGCSEVTTTGGATAGTILTVGTTSCTTIVTMGNSATAPNGWACYVHDSTGADFNNPHMTSTSTTTATIVSGTIVSGDTLTFACIGY